MSNPVCSHLVNPVDQGITALNCKSNLYFIAARTAQVAIVAFAALTIAASLALLPFAFPAPLILVGVGCSVGLMPLVSKLERWSESCHQQAKFLEQIATRYKEIEYWTEKDVRRFLEKQHLRLNQEALDSLRSLNGQEPLRALLPLIARFQALQDKAAVWTRVYDENLKKSDALVDNPDLELRHFAFGWDSMESQLVPAALESAVTLQNMLEPQRTLSLADAGELKTRNFLHRAIDRWKLRFPPSVFTARDGRNLHLDKLAEIQFSPREIRPLIF
jgi:hypothetical protein